MKMLRTRSCIFLASAAVLVAGSTLARAADPREGYSFGSCTLTGKPNTISLTTLEKDTLTVATPLPNPGWWNGTSPSSISSGFEYCLAADIAYRAGLHHLKIVNMAWDQYISGTSTGYDIALGSTTITPARQKVFNFSRPYFYAGLGVATLTSNNISEGNVKGKRIAVLQGNVGADWVTHILKPQSVLVYQSSPDMFTALMAHQIDAVVTDTTLALTQAKMSNGNIRVVGQYKVDQGYGIITAKTSVNTQAIDKAVAEFAADGTLKQLSTTYLQPMFGVSPDSVPGWSLK